MTRSLSGAEISEKTNTKAQNKSAKHIIYKAYHPYIIYAGNAKKVKE